MSRGRTLDQRPSPPSPVSSAPDSLVLLADLGVDSFHEEVRLCVDVPGGPCGTCRDLQLPGVVVDRAREDLDLPALQVGDRLLNLGYDVRRDARVDGADRN